MTSINDHRHQTKGVMNSLVVDGHVDCIFEECGVCQDLEKLEEKIRAAEETLRNLAQERTTLKTSRNGSHSGFIRQLPIEIISKIFLLVDGPIDYSSTNKRNPAFPENYICAPAHLSSVCRRWREIALGLPQLWSKAYINVCREPDEITEKWLNRSRPLPLNLTLYTTEEFRWQGANIAPLFALLRSHSTRWSYLNIDLAPRWTLHRLFNNLEVFPQSDSFHLRLGRYNDPQRVSLSIPLQLGCFYSTATDFTVCALPFGWSNLTHLELQNYETNRVLEVMRQAPKLKHCILLRSMRNPEDVGQANVTEIQPIVLEFLEYLELTFYHNGAHFLRHLTLPSWQYLKCDLDENKFNSASHSNESDVHELGNLLARSGISPISLETFDLGYHASFWPESNSMWFQEIRDRVTHLSIDTRPGNSNALDSFLLQASDITVLLPRLQELRLRIFPGYVNYHPGQHSEGSVSTPSMDSTTCAALCDFIVQLNSAINLERETSNHTTNVDDDSIPNSNPTHSNHGHDRHSLKSITIRSVEYQSFSFKMTRDTLSRLREAQKNGPLKLEISTKGRDVLQDPQWENDGGDGYILLRKSR